MSPDAQTLHEIEQSIEREEPLTTPEAVCETIELCAPEEEAEPRGRRRETAAVTPPPRQAPKAPAAEPEREEEIARPTPRPVPAKRARRAAPPLAPRVGITPEPPEAPPNMLARNVALGVGGTGLMVSAVAIAANVEARSNVGWAVGGAALGIGVIGLTTAGILTLTQDDDEGDKRARVRPTGDGLQVSF